MMNKLISYLNRVFHSSLRSTQSEKTKDLNNHQFIDSVQDRVIYEYKTCSQYTPIYYASRFF